MYVLLQVWFWMAASAGVIFWPCMLLDIWLKPGRELGWFGCFAVALLLAFMSLSAVCLVVFAGFGAWCAWQAG